MGKNYIFSFSVAFALKQTREHIVLKGTEAREFFLNWDYGVKG